jgi:hypothetical protein
MFGIYSSLGWRLMQIFFLWVDFFQVHVSSQEMNGSRQMELHYINTGFPYTVTESFMDFFEGLTYAHGDFAHTDAFQDQVHEHNVSNCLRLSYRTAMWFHPFKSLIVELFILQPCIFPSEM